MHPSLKKFAFVLVGLSVVSAVYAAYAFIVDVPSREVVTGTPAVTLTLEDSTVHCPSGGSPRMRMWDNARASLWDGAPLTVPIAPDAVLLNGSVINATVWCSTGAGMWEGYVSPTITASSIGTEAGDIGVHVYINGEERPAFICWDIVALHSDPVFHRIQFRADAAGTAAGCFPSTL